MVTPPSSTYAMSSAAVDAGPVEYSKFDAQPTQDSRSMPIPYSPRRATSLHSTPTTPQRIPLLDSRSASALPTFAFNSGDVSGRTDSPAGVAAWSDVPSSLGSRGFGHRRGVSELVGHSGLVNTSPSKPFTGSLTPQGGAAFGSPARKKGHAHRRSAAVSMHDVQTILRPIDVNTLMAPSVADSTSAEDNSDYVAMPKSQDKQSSPSTSILPRPRVGFSSNIEFIPRPLSTISSEAESVSSMHIHHSPGSSTTSPLRPSSFGNSPKRQSISGRSSLSEVEAVATSYPPDDGHAAFAGVESVLESEEMHVDPCPQQTSDMVAHDFSLPPRRSAKLDRRSSEPSLSLTSLQRPRRSSASLRDPLKPGVAKRTDSKLGRVERKSSASRVKSWASGFLQRKDRELAVPDHVLQNDTLPDSDLPQDDMTLFGEPDLEELFSHDPFGQHEDPRRDNEVHPSRMDLQTMRTVNPVWSSGGDSEPVIDLDAAFGPDRTPSRDSRPSGFGARRQFHSGRMNREFSSPSNVVHRRAESAPSLTPFEYGSSSSPVHSPMADVFEEDEEDEVAKSARNSTVIPITFNFPQASSDQEMLYQQSEEYGLEMNDAEQSTSPTRTPTSMQHSPLSHLKDIDMEEMRPVEIVEAYEEPRTSVFTKSSESSEALTITSDHFSQGPPQTTHVALSGYNMSTFSTPDLSHQQNSFDGPRLGTSTSSATDCRTFSSYASERHVDNRVSVDDVPSLTSSRSTMISAVHPSRRDLSDRSSTFRARQMSDEEQEKRRRKRSSIQSLTKLMSGPFGESRNKLSLDHNTDSMPNLVGGKNLGRKKEHRLSRLMFWRNKSSRTDAAAGL